MNQMKSTSDASTTSTTSKSSDGTFGRQFLQARNSLDMSLDDASKELNILKRHLDAIENEDFEALPQMAFARGFVSNYAKLLKLDAEQMVDTFNRIYPEQLRKPTAQEVQSPIKPMGTLSRDSKRSIKFNPWLILGVVFLIGLAVVLLRTISNAQDANRSDNEGNMVNELSESEQTAGAAVDTSATGTGLEQNGVIIQDTVSTQIQNMTQSPTVDAQTLANTADSTLDFWIRGDTNVIVVDASGQVLLNGGQTRGGYKVVGKPPFRIQIDNASNVALTIDQERVRISDYAQDNQANFTLAP